MRRVRCGECGKSYDFDVDDFCPRCGAFNQPPKTAAINADGSVVRVEGINEKNHAGSFVHAELHEENRERRRTGLSKGVRRTAAAARPAASAGSSRGQGSQASPVMIVFWVIAAIMAVNVLSVFFRFFLYW